MNQPADDVDRRRQYTAFNRERRRPPQVGFLAKLGGIIAVNPVIAWMRTLDARVIYYDRSVDPACGLGGPKIYIFWHEYILLPLSLRGHCHISMLISQHRDADLLARVAYHAGFDCVRGSTFRGAASATRELIRRGDRQHIAITPDGPRGPRRTLEAGAIYLASRLGLPLVVLGLGYDRPWRLNSWDQFAIPRPCSRARAVIGPPIWLPAGLGRSRLDECRGRIERLLNSLTEEAEAWATAGTRKVGEFVLTSQSSPPPANMCRPSILDFVPRPGRAA
jgi:lysophospholipid acyltransferase (LPLAT)-like uncharacterized protein